MDTEMTDLPPTSLLALPVTSAPTSTKETGLETETRLHSSTTKTKDHSVKPDLQLLPINSPFDSASDDEDYQLKEVPHAILTSPSANHLSDSSPNKPSSKMVKRIQPINVKRIPSKRQKTDIYTPKRLLQNEKTELANVDIKAILCDEEGWAKLSDDARAEIVSKIPNTLRHEMMIGDDGQPRPNLKFLEKNSTFKSFINQALNDVVNGLNEPNWLAQAYNAHCKRSYGKFDDFKDKNYEEFWGVKQRLASNAIAGTSAHHNLGEMIDREVVKPGDVFKYSRSFRNRSMVIKKEAEFLGCRTTKEGRIYQRFRFGAGTTLVPKGDDTDVIVEDIDGPESFGRALIRIHGEYTDRVPNGNTWKNIRLIRKNEDLGTLWDMRQHMHYLTEDEDEDRGAIKSAKTRRTKGAANGKPSTTRTRSGRKSLAPQSSP